MRLGGKTEQRHLGNDTLWLFMQVIFWLLTFALIGGGNLLIVARSRTCRQHVNEVISTLTLRPIEASPTAGDTQGSEVKLNITHTSKKGKFLHPYPANPSLQFHWSCAEVTFLLHSRDTRACTSFEKLQKCSKWEVLGNEFLLEGSRSSDRGGWVVEGVNRKSSASASFPFFPFCSSSPLDCSSHHTWALQWETHRGLTPALLPATHHSWVHHHWGIKTCISLNISSRNNPHRHIITTRNTYPPCCFHHHPPPL